MLDEADPAVQTIQDELFGDTPEREREIALRVMRGAMERLSLHHAGR